MAINYIKDDVINLVDRIRDANPDKLTVLMHGCNCYNTMGAGLALTIRKNYSEAYRADLNTLAGDNTKLGHFSYADIDDTLTVVNLYTQFNYGNDGKQYVSYEAIEFSIKRAITMFETNERYAIKEKIYCVPQLIGCGLAGGDPKIVGSMLEAIFFEKEAVLFSN